MRDSIPGSSQTSTEVPIVVELELDLLVEIMVAGHDDVTVEVRGRRGLVSYRNG